MPFGLFGVAMGDPAGVAFAQTLGATWIAVPPSRVPLARLAAAQAAGST
jgi:pyruvate,orthophosphate dikinase